MPTATPPPKILLPHGGYRRLIVYRKSDLVYEGTVAFCRRFLDARKDRTVDQMVQAARSCKQNIAEGSTASGTSKETELRLVNVARASLDELVEDYLDALKSRGAAVWPADAPEAKAARDFAARHPDRADWQDLFDTRPPETLANLMLTLCYQTRYLLDRLLARLEADFTKHGGFRERMHAARTAERGREWAPPLLSRLESSPTPDELAARVAEVREALARMAQTIRRKRGWD